MGILSKMRRMKAVYWAPVRVGPNGETVFDSPVELRVRWEDSHVLVKDPTGEEFTSDAVVYVGEDVKPKGMLWLGELTSGTPEDPNEQEDAVTIRQFEKLPDIKCKKFLRTAYIG
jgi:hypothetical protein